MVEASKYNVSRDHVVSPGDLLLLLLLANDNDEIVERCSNAFPRQMQRTAWVGIWRHYHRDDIACTTPLEGPAAANEQERKRRSEAQVRRDIRSRNKRSLRITSSGISCKQAFRHILTHR